MRWVAMMVSAIALTGCSPREPTVEDAWVRLPAVPGRPAAAYFTIHGGQVDRTLTRATTPRARSAELHESMAGGMRSIAAVPVAASADVAFAPGGRHVMIFGLDPRVKPGATVPLELDFEGRPVSVDAKVVGAADPAP